MMKSKNSPLFCGLLLFCSLSFFSGCLTTQSQESANLRDVVARKNELFAKLHKELVLNKLAKNLNSGGVIFLGSGEGLSGLNTPFSSSMKAGTLVLELNKDFSNAS